ncbi:MAG: hypothetical protein KY455_02930 [Euryarchaeota archaeon]|nr:hypothetical protein [Euryarchaeota archaeon]
MQQKIVALVTLWMLTMGTVPGSAADEAQPQAMPEPCMPIYGVYEVNQACEKTQFLRDCLAQEDHKENDNCDGTAIGWVWLGCVQNCITTTHQMVKIGPSLVQVDPPGVYLQTCDYDGISVPMLLTGPYDCPLDGQPKNPTPIVVVPDDWTDPQRCCGVDPHDLLIPIQITTGTCRVYVYATYLGAGVEGRTQNYPCAIVQA